MLTATVDYESTGKGVDALDISCVRYTIIAHVTSTEPSEVVTFDRAWKEKYPEYDKFPGAGRYGQTVKIVSPGWVYLGAGTERMRKALVEMGVEVEDAPS